MKEISEVICREVKDPRITSMISVLNVSMSHDMRNAKVAVSIFGGNELENLKSLEALNSAAGFVSSIASKSLRLKWAPRIHFVQSHAIEESVEMYFKLKDIVKDEKIDESDELPPA
jgi:ribosome-binding factor A